VGVALDEHSPETPLQDVSHPVVGAVKPLGIHAVDLPHAAGEAHLGRLDEEVVVVRHEAIGMADPVTTLDGIAEDPQERLTVDISEEDGFAGITSGGHVVEGAGELDPEWPCHGLEA